MTNKPVNVHALLPVIMSLVVVMAMLRCRKVHFEDFPEKKSTINKSFVEVSSGRSVLSVCRLTLHCFLIRK